MTKFIQSILIFVLVFVMNVAVANAQTTAFTYQGSLNNGAAPANGNYDFEFALFDAVSGGAQVGSTVTTANIAVSNGVFSVNLNFGSQFPGANRFLEIRVRQTGSGAFTTLAPRNPVNSSPYAVKSLTAETATTATTATNATLLGGVAANQYVLTGDARLTNARPPTSGSNSYIQNSTILQSPTDFNIGGTGTANILNAVTQYNMNGQRVLSGIGSGNLFVGQATGRFITTGQENTFVGDTAGFLNETGGQNSFFGNNAGRNSVFASGNSFFGDRTGQSVSGSLNSFFGKDAGQGTTTGSRNTFVGHRAAVSNISGDRITILGSEANVGAVDLSFATAIGSQSVVSTNNTVKLGRVNDQVIAPGALIVGNSTTQRGNLSVYSNSGNADVYLKASPGSVGINLGVGSVSSGNPFFYISHYDGTTYSDRFVITPSGFVQITSLGSSGSTSVCRNANNELSACSSSRKYKKNIDSFRPGLALVKKLRPVSFDWKSDFTKDIGLVAEEVAEAEPLLTTKNEKGEVEGVKYDRVGVVLVNAVQEQQVMIETQAAEIKLLVTKLNALQYQSTSQNQEILELKQRIEELEHLKTEAKALKQLVCSVNTSADICRTNED